MNDKVLIDRELLEEVLLDLESGMMCNPSAETLQQLRALLSEQPQASAAQSAPAEPKPTGLSRGWNLVRQCDGFVIGHSAEEPKEHHKQQALADGRVYVPFMVEQSAPAGEREAFKQALHSQTTFKLTADRIEAAEWGAAWQRTQSAGVPEGWLVRVMPNNKETRQVELASTAVKWIMVVPVNVAKFFEPLAAPAQPAAQGEFGDAYQGAREDLAIWKRRALEAEAKVRHQDQIIDHLTLEAQGETRMGEPVFPAAHDQGEVQRLREARLLAEVEELDVARTELAEVKGQEVACFVVGKLEKTAVIDSPLPVGTKLYARPPASPDVEGLVEALRGLCEGMRACGVHGGPYLDYAEKLVADYDSALSTWRQGQGKP